MRKPGLKSIRIKFLLPLLLVALISLSAALLLRGFIVSDFRHFLEGAAEDRVQTVLTDLEGKYERENGFHSDSLTESCARALILGMEVKLFDPAGKELMNSRRAFDALTPLMKKRVQDAVGAEFSDPGGSFTTYPLFLAGKEIGHLEVRHLEPANEEVFIRTSNRYLLYISLTLGGLAVFLGVILSRRLTAPIERLTRATGMVAAGDYSVRAPVLGRDELTRLAESFNTMAGALETQDKLRKKLMSNAAHELRTPLMVIRGELEGMMDGVLPLKREGLQSLHDEATRLAAILEGMDDLTRAEASSLSLRRYPLMMAPFLEILKDRFSRLATESGIEFKVACSAEAKALADPDRLSQILINLFSNAVKATPAEGKILLNAWMEGNEAVLEISDTGRGIPASDLPYIFERFYRVENSGLGLGLAIVHELVVAHNGSICVTSMEDKGTSFTVRLPAG